MTTKKESPSLKGAAFKAFLNKTYIVILGTLFLSILELDNKRFFAKLSPLISLVIRLCLCPFVPDNKNFSAIWVLVWCFSRAIIPWVIRGDILRGRGVCLFLRARITIPFLGRVFLFVRIRVTITLA